MSDIIFNVIDWNDKDEYDDEDSEEESLSSSYVMEAFGRTKDDKSVYLKINGFTPFFFVKISNSWKKSHVDRFISFVKNQVYWKYKNSLVAYDIVKRNKLYGFTAGKQFKFVRLVFNTNEAMKKFSYIFYKKHKIPGLDSSFKKYELYESNIPPLLRFMHIQDIDASGWIKINEDKYTKVSTRGFNTDLAFETKWTNVLSHKEQTFSRIRIASFDLECTSGDGSFPQATRKTDKIIQIGTTFSYNGEENCYKKHIVTLGSCDPIEGVEVESYESEKKLILAWQKLINREDPDILTGYNIFGFDNKYLHDRAQFLGIEEKFGKFSRIRKFKCEYKDAQLSSSALGVNNMRYYNTHGRVQIDLMKVVMRDYKLSSYKLDSVAESFLKGSVLSITNNKLTVEKSDDLVIGDYIKLVQNDDLVEDGKKYQILDKPTNSEIILNTSPKINEGKITWTMSKDDVKPADIFRLQKGSSADRKIVAKYCIQDCALVNKLMARLCVVINNISMANVCVVPLSFLFFRGQGIKIFSLVAKECRKKNYLIPVKRNSKNNGSNTVGYEGATVFDPTIGFYKRPIAVLDYASLYPSSMIHKNLSHETFVDNPKYDNHPDYIYYNTEYRNADGTKTKCRYAKNKDGTKGIMCQILDKLLKTRSSVKKLMKNENDPFMKSIFDGLQQAYKVTANSLYGQLGSTFSQICFKQIAASTTSIGREMLEFARDYMENVFPGIVEGLYEGFSENDDVKVKKILDKELVADLNNDKFINNMKDKIIKVLNNCTIEPKTIYGDTDSVFIDFVLKKDGEYYENKVALEYAIDLGVIAGNLVKSRLPQPHDLEYEKTFHPFCILSKKRYVGNKYEFDKNKFKQNSMGIVLKRRDNSKIVKYVVGGMVDILMNEVNVEKAVKYIKKSIGNLLKGKYPLYYFVTTKTLKSNYKDRTRIGHVCLADRMKERDPGNAPQVNERIPYVAIVVPQVKGKKLLQGDRIEHPNYVIENNLKVDYLFYLTNQVMKPTVQFLKLLVDDAQEIFDEVIQLEKNKRSGNIGIDKFFNVSKKGGNKKKTNLRVKRVPSKNMIKYYLNEDNPDLEKMGFQIEEDDESEDDKKVNTSDEEKESKNNKEYKKLFLNLGVI